MTNDINHDQTMTITIPCAQDQAGRWLHAAQNSGLPLQVWIRTVLDCAAAEAEARAEEASLPICDICGGRGIAHFMHPGPDAVRYIRERVAELTHNGTGIDLARRIARREDAQKYRQE